MAPNTLSVKESLSFGWRTFKSRPWIFVQAMLALFALSFVLNALQDALGASAREGGVVLALLAFVFALGATYLNIVIANMGATSFSLKAHDDASSVTLKDLWRPHPFWKYVGTILLLALIVIVGFILLIVPGVILALMLWASVYLVLDKGLGPVAALKESRRMTKGNRWKLFLLSLAIIGINIVGFLALFVGLLVTGPVSMLASAHAYRKLSEAPAVSE